MAYADNFILVRILFPYSLVNLCFVHFSSNIWEIVHFTQPVGEVGEAKSMYKSVVLGGDVWDLLDELMIYMGNPMQFYEKDVTFVRVS